MTRFVVGGETVVKSDDMWMFEYGGKPAAKWVGGGATQFICHWKRCPDAIRKLTCWPGEFETVNLPFEVKE